MIANKNHTRLWILLLFMIGSLACQEHVCEEITSQCGVTNIEIQPTRLALPSIPDGTHLQLQIKFGGGSFAETLLGTVSQTGWSQDLWMYRSPLDRSQYILDLTPVALKIKPGELWVGFRSLPKRVRVVLFDREPFAKVDRVTLNTTRLGSYDLTFAYSLTVAGPDLIVFGSIGTGAVNQNIRYRIGQIPLSLTPIVLMSYPYGPHPNTWLGGTGGDPKLEFYFGKADSASERYRVLRCPDTAITDGDCVGIQSTIPAGFGSALDADFRSFALDRDGKLIALTNGTRHEAFRFDTDHFTQIPMPEGYRLHQMTPYMKADRPEILALSEDFNLFRYRYRSEKEGFDPPVLVDKMESLASEATVLSLADVNRDGLPDIVLGAGKTIRFGINTGDSPGGDFEWEPAPYTLNTSAYPIRSLTLSDLDHDGRLDIVSASDRGAQSPESAIEFFLTGN